LPVNAVRKKVAYERDVADRITGQITGAATAMRFP
jgi:hypothetical protein